MNENQDFDVNYDEDDISSDQTDQSDAVTEMFGDKECRWYQIAARNMVEDALAHNPTARSLVQLPTGAGKTLTSGMIFSSPKIRKTLGVADGEKLRLLFVAHKHRLLTQAELAFADAEGVEFIQQSAFSDIPPELIAKGWHMTCLDEAHHEAMSTFQYMLDNLSNIPLLGLTATPNRADGCLIKFHEIINPISREQAVEEGWLAPTTLHSFVDVPSKDKISVLTTLFDNYAHQMGQTMVFVKSKREVKEITKLLNNMGYTTVGILDQSNKELDRVLNRFSDGWIQFLVNCNKINEGVDVVGCTDVVLGRQYGSYTQLNQVIGRASRPDSECNVWELVNPLSSTNLDTTVVVGTPTAHRLISYEGKKWVERTFDYITHRTNKQLGISSGIGVRGRVG